MPRPQPVIIPGPGSMGMDMQQHQSEFNLTGLIQLLDATLGRHRRRARDVEAAKALAPLVNIPEADIEAVTGSPAGRQTIFDLIKQREPEGETELFSTPRMYQTDKGEYRWGFFSKQGEMVKDIRKATKKDIEGAAAVNVNILKGLPAETAGKLAMLRQANKEIREVEGMLFDKKGNVKLLSQATGYLNIPAAKGRKINSRIENAIAAKLRIETGATATPDEIKNISRRFKPVPGVDNAEATRDKLRRLREFLGEASFYVDPTGKYTAPQGRQQPTGRELTYDPTTGELR